MLGALLAVAGVCYLVNSYALILSPPLAGRLFPAILMPAFVAALALWLLVRGIDASAWAEHAAAESREPASRPDGGRRLG